MPMLKKEMILVGLILFSLPTNAGHTLEGAAKEVIMGFQREGARSADSLIDKKTGLYVLFHRGASMDVKSLKQINFKQLVSGYFPWPSAGEHVSRDDGSNKRTVPKFNHERSRNK